MLLFLELTGLSGQPTRSFLQYWLQPIDILPEQHTGQRPRRPGWLGPCLELVCRPAELPPSASSVCLHATPSIRMVRGGVAEPHPLRHSQIAGLWCSHDSGRTIWRGQSCVLL